MTATIQFNVGNGKKDPQHYVLVRGIGKRAIKVFIRPILFSFCFEINAKIEEKLILLAAKRAAKNGWKKICIEQGIEDPISMYSYNVSQQTAFFYDNLDEGILLYSFERK